VAATRARAEIRTKRFPGFTGAEEDRFSATLEARGSSPLAMLQALAEVMAGSDEMQRSSNGEPLILEIRLVAG
jgi:hypothetical protein